MTPFLQTPRIIFDHGAIRALPAELAQLGSTRPLLITDRGLVRAGLLDRLRAALPAAMQAPLFDQVPENPTAAAVDAAFALYRTENCDAVVALGGGSVLDSGKAVAVLAGHADQTGWGRCADYMGHPDRITHRVAPLIAIPTTAGTGSEASHGSGIHPSDTTRAIGLGSAWIIPRVAICDPDFTQSLPRHLIAQTGLDALSHCIEGFLATQRNPLLDAVALDGARRVQDWVERATEAPDDAEARWQMMLAALAGGMAIPKGLGPIHAIAGTLGDQGLHHGLLVSLAMPPVLRLHTHHAPERMGALAQTMGVSSGMEVADEIAALNHRLGLPATLRAAGYRPGDMDEMAASVAESRFNLHAPYRPSVAEAMGILREVIG